MKFRKTTLLGACAAALFSLSLARAQAPSSYVVKSDDTLLTIAEQLRGPKATMNQMAYALARANMGAFNGRPALVPAPAGAKLVVPDQATALATDPRKAEVEVAKMWRGEQYYKAAQALEKSHDLLYAFDTYVYAAKLGHGPSQLRLGQLYDRDLSGFVRHDLVESVGWYERARQQQVPIESAARRGPGMGGANSN
jgi:TPR repeat protein